MQKILIQYEKPLQLKENITFRSDARRKGEVVHSGHFMISSVADDQEDNEMIDHNRDSPNHHEQSIMYKFGYDFSNVDRETKDTYQFGHLSNKQITIDASLARLFQCMSLAYHGGKVVSPKWKNFKGLKLTVKDKIRLNNAIWRTWHIQYVMRKRKHQSAIQFATPLEIDTNAHSRPEAVVMEGKYWKRRIETVVAEYKKWRGFFMEKLKLSDYPGLMWVSESASNSPSKDPFTCDKSRFHDDVMGTEFSDTLFSNLSQQPFHFPNPREIAMHATNSDMIQPGLLQLQPIMDDVDFDPFQELLNPSKKAVISFSGNTTNQSNDLFQIGDYSHVTEDQSLVAPSSLQSLSSFNSQPMDFVGNFPNNQAQNDLPILNDAISTVDAMLSGVGDAPAFYQSNGVHHDHPRPALNRQQSATNQGSAVVITHAQQPHHQFEARAPPSGDLQLQQFNQLKQPPNFSNVHPMANAVLNGEIGTPQTHYPLSKQVISVPVNNKITYSHTQTSQRLGFFPRAADTHQQRVVTFDQRNVNASSHANTSLPAQVVLDPIANPINEVPPQTMDVAAPAFQQQANNVVVSSESMFLKRLLTNNAPAEYNQSRRKRNSLPNAQSSIQPKPNRQFSPVSNQATSNPVINSAFSYDPNPKNPFTISEKRKKIGDEFTSLPVASDVWPHRRKASSSSPVKPIHDIDMESVSIEPVVPLTQDNDAMQMESSTRQSFSTEQKRRFNIKLGFTRLQSLLPGCSTQPNAKISKATLLTKTAHYVKSLQNERARIKEEVQSIKQELEILHQAINATQLELPATGAPAPRPRTSESKALFETWVKRRTMENWKFSLFGVIAEPWFDSYHGGVAVTNLNEFIRTFFLWLDDQCSLRQLRPNVVRSLQVICTTTCILTNPSQLKQQIESSVKDQDIDQSKCNRPT